MGTMIQATCTCGYTSDVLLEGCGMAGPHTCRELGRCDYCREVVSIIAGSVRPRCPKCRRKVVVLTSAEGAGDGLPNQWPSPPVGCPRCHHATMRLEMAGLWD